MTGRGWDTNSRCKAVWSMDEHSLPTRCPRGQGQHFLQEDTPGVQGLGSGLVGGGCLPGHGRVVEHERSLHAEQRSQAPGHHVVQQDGARRGRSRGGPTRGAVNNPEAFNRCTALCNHTCMQFLISPKGKSRPGSRPTPSLLSPAPGNHSLPLCICLFPTFH